MLHWLLAPLYRQVCGIIRKSLGLNAKALIGQVNTLWKDVVRSVDTMLNDSIGEFIQDFGKYNPVPDKWEDEQGVDRKGLSIPLDALRDLIVFRAIQLDPRQVQQRRDPWFTFDSLGMTPAVQADVVEAIARHRFPGVIEGRIGSVIGTYGPTDYVLVANRLEAYTPMSGTPKLAKIAQRYSTENAKGAKNTFDKGKNYRRGGYDEAALKKSLPPGKYF